MSALAWLFVLASLVALDGRAIPVMLPAIASTFGVLPGEAGWSVTSYTLAYGGLQLAYGPLSDRYGRLTVVRATTLLFVVGVILSSVATTLTEFVLARLLTGAFAAAMIPTAFAYMGDTVPYERRQTVIGQFGATIAASQVLSLTVAGIVTYAITWRAMFVAIAVLAFVPVFLIRQQATAAPRLAGEALPYWRIAVRPAARRVYAAVFAEGVFALGGTTYLAVIAKARYGLNDLEVGLLLGIYGLGAGVASLSLRRLAPTLGERWLARAGGIVQLVAWILVPVAALRGVSPVVFAALGLGYVWLHSTLQTRATELVPEARGKAIALFALALFMGGAAGTAIFGRVVDRDLHTALGVICGVGLAAVGYYVGRRA
ncbi:MAG: MFS transporter [Candidatus Rokubacteria bacterium]|nr:MFS transporter [Candidatus Rokubacteria bacterium]